MRIGLTLGLCALLCILALSSPGKTQPAKSAKGTEPTMVQGRAVPDWIKDLQAKELLPRIRALNALMQAGPQARAAAPALLSLFAEPDASFLHPLAGVALSRIGSDAIPELLKALDDPRSGVPAGAAWTLGLLGPLASPAVPALSKALRDKDPSVRQAAAQALSRIGRNARAARETLHATLRDKDLAVAVEAAGALWHIASDARGIDLLREALSQDRTAVVARALAILGEMGPKAKAAVPALRKTLDHRERTTRLLAAEALYRVSQDSKATLPVVEAALSGKDSGEMRQALSLLGIMSADEKAVSLLVRHLSSSNVEVRREAAAALTEGAATHEVARKALMQGLTDADLSVRWWCALGLTLNEEAGRTHEEDLLRTFRRARIVDAEGEPAGRLVGEVLVPERATRALAILLQGKPSHSQIEIIRCVVQLKFDARPAQAELVQALQSENKQLRRAAAEALATIGVAVVPTLERLLSHSDRLFREGAARALGQMGGAARSSQTALTRLLKDPDSTVRTQAALALWFVADNTELSLPILNLVLKDIDHEDRWEAVEAIGIISMQARPAIKGITEILLNGVKDRDARVRAHAARWLWRRTRQPSRIVPLIRDLLSDRDAFTRLTAVEILGEMAGQDRSLPLLMQALEDRDLLVRLLAEEGLSRGGEDALPQLEQALTSTNPRVRQGVIRALERMGSRAKALLPALRKLQKDPDPLVRAAVRDALTALASEPNAK